MGHRINDGDGEISFSEKKENPSDAAKTIEKSKGTLQNVFEWYITVSFCAFILLFIVWFFGGSSYLMMLPEWVRLLFWIMAPGAFIGFFLGFVESQHT